MRSHGYPELRQKETDRTPESDDPFDDGSSFKLTHTFRQHPKRTVEADVLVDTVH